MAIKDFRFEQWGALCHFYDSVVIDGIINSFEYLCPPSHVGSIARQFFAFIPDSGLNLSLFIKIF